MAHPKNRFFPGSSVLSSPLYEIENHLLKNSEIIETWLSGEWKKTPAPFYASVDLRHAGFKIAPVDTNLFPAGFNNLSSDQIPYAVNAIKRALNDSKKVLLIPEAHTRNQYYLENVARLSEIISLAGVEIRIGSINPDLTEPQSLLFSNSKSLLLEPIVREGDLLKCQSGFVPDLILLNHDLTGGAPEFLKNIKQKITPALSLGWSVRLKSNHFAEYQAIIEALSAIIDCDPWFLMPLFRNCGLVDFKLGVGEECLEKQIEALLQMIQLKYDYYKITQKPYVIVKTDSGSYGMGVLSIQNAREIRHLNRKQKKELATTKGGAEVTKVILQEGVYSIEQVDLSNAVAEPVVYMIGEEVIGGFYRSHPTKRDFENLNAPGMQFIPFDTGQDSVNPIEAIRRDRFKVYSIVARLALLAAAREQDPHNLKSA